MNFQLLPLNPCGLAQFKRDMRAYPAGTRVRLLVMDDSHASPTGTLGTVSGVDDAGQLSVRWDNGRRLKLVPGEDLFKVVEDGFGSGSSA